MKRFSVVKPADLLSVERARTLILERFSRLPTELVDLASAHGRVLGTPIESKILVPPFANSSMDGFALRSQETVGADAGNPIRLHVTSHIQAGKSPTVPVTEGTSARIMTGAPLPAGADAVIPFEDVEESDGWISLRTRIGQGACVRAAGQDVRPGAPLLEAGAELAAPQIALLAATGHGEVLVTRRPRVAVIATGDELIAPGQTLSPGQIYNSNSPMLVAAVREAGGEAVAVDVVGDTVDVLRRAMEDAAGCDLMLTSGGASVGDWDYVKDVLGESGAVNFWRVRLRPGKPLIFGTFGDVPVLGLPGNPTSAMVTFEQFARPAIRRLLGATLMRPLLSVTVRERIENGGGRRTYARVLLHATEDGWEASLAGGQDSAMLLPLALADGLLEIPEDCAELLPGDRAVVQVWRLPAGG